MNFFMNMIPPTATHQQKKISRSKTGRPVVYEPYRVKDARDKLMSALWKERPDRPYLGPVMLKVMWLFPAGRHKNGDWKITRPDTDNLQKLLKDCMTDCEFWEDDAQVCVEHVEKRWSDYPGIWIQLNGLTCVNEDPVDEVKEI